MAIRPYFVSFFGLTTGVSYTLPLMGLVTGVVTGFAGVTVLCTLMPPVKGAVVVLFFATFLYAVAMSDPPTA